MKCKHSNPIVWLMACAVCYLICGCQDAVKDGFTGGVETGIASIVASLLEEGINGTR